MCKLIWSHVANYIYNSYRNYYCSSVTAERNPAVVIVVSYHSIKYLCCANNMYPKERNLSVCYGMYYSYSVKCYIKNYNVAAIKRVNQPMNIESIVLSFCSLCNMNIGLKHHAIISMLINITIDTTACGRSFI